jgi:hypothetical protein
MPNTSRVADSCLPENIGNVPSGLYRLRSNLSESRSLVSSSAACYVAILVPEGTIIEVEGGPIDGFRPVDGRYEGVITKLFTNDMEAHTELLKGKHAGMA